MPELQIDLGDVRVMLEHHVLLWKETAVNIELKKLPGGIKRKIAGLDFFITRSVGPGRIAFSRDSPGQCIPLHLRQGQELHVREHQFVAATDNLDYTFERVKGVRNMLLGGSGFFMDKFRATNGDALVWLHGHGNVFLVNLEAGEQIDVEAGRLAVQGPDGEDGGGDHGPQDGPVRRRRQAHLEPLHRPGPAGDPDAVHLAAGGRRERHRRRRHGRHRGRRARRARPRIAAQPVAGGM